MTRAYSRWNAKHFPKEKDVYHGIPLAAVMEKPEYSSAIDEYFSLNYGTKYNEVDDQGKLKFS